MTQIHPLDPEDATITAATRAMLSSSKGARPGIEARGQYDALMERVLPREDVTVEEDTLGGVPARGHLPPSSCRSPSDHSGACASRRTLLNRTRSSRIRSGTN